MNGTSLQASGGNTASNCRGTATDLTKACWAGGTIAGVRQPDAACRNDVRAGARTGSSSAFQNLTDPANPGKQVVLRILKKEELRNVDGSDSLHPNRSGDVVVVLRPPYQSDAGDAGAARSPSRQFFGQHGYLPNLVDIAHNVNMHATFVAAGPASARRTPVAGIRAIDIAPTLAFLMGIPGPQNARGQDPLQPHHERRAAQGGRPSSTSATTTAS